MKALNFSVKEILPSLLNKSKTQTIRPAWKDIDLQKEIGVFRKQFIEKNVEEPKIIKMSVNTRNALYSESMKKIKGWGSGANQKTIYGMQIIDKPNILGFILHSLKHQEQYFIEPKKPPCFKVGEEVEIKWKKESKYESFCRRCGGENLIMSVPALKCYLCEDCKYRMEYPFNKHLGTAEITEVFKIEMSKTMSGYHLTDWQKGVCSHHGTMSYCEDLAKRDGFSSAEQMFKTLDKMYDLSQPKQFYVYRWGWLK